MLKDYLKIALRNLSKHKFHAFVNIFGLALGMACCIIILLYLKEELSYDRFHPQAENIFRITEKTQTDALTTHTAHTYSATAPALANEFPEVSSAVRFFNHNAMVTFDKDETFQEPGFFYVDSTVFDVFSFKVLKGDLSKSLDHPFALVLTERMAHKYFGDKNPINRVVNVDESYDFRITAVIADPPKNSHLQVDFLASFSSLKNFQGGWMYNNWYYPPMYTYVKLLDSDAQEALEDKLPGMIEKYLGPAEKTQRQLRLQPLTAIHTSQQLENEWGATISQGFVIVLFTVAILVLAIACVNFMNLSMAMSSGRSTEVGLRKVVGAYKVQLIAQFLVESLLISLIASVLAFVLLLMILPFFNDIAGSNLQLDLPQSALLFGAFFLLAILTGISAGYYPSVFLSSLNPIAALKGFSGSKGSLKIRRGKGLVVFQFLITTTLIIGTLVIGKQLHYLKNKELGFNKELVVVVPIRDTNDGSRIKTLKDRLECNSHIIVAGASARVPGSERLADYNIRPEGKDTEDNLMFFVLHTSFDFEKTLGMKMIQGRGFDIDIASDSSAVILNENALAKLGWKDPIGKKIDIGALGKDGSFQALHSMQVIGVVKNFNYSSLHHKIDPIMMSIGSAHMNDYLSIRITPEKIPGTLDFIKEQWEIFSPGRSFEYFFLDESFDRLYHSEERLSKIFFCFSLLSIFIACMGLFAMASFTARQRSKEIGIRKILGASMKVVLVELLTDFSKLVFIAFLIAVPVAYFGLKSWLDNFAYRTEIGPGVFLMAGFVSIIITLITTGYQALKAAGTDPVNVIRND